MEYVYFIFFEYVFNKQLKIVLVRHFVTVSYTIMLLEKMYATKM